MKKKRYDLIVISLFSKIRTTMSFPAFFGSLMNAKHGGYVLKKKEHL